MITINWSTGKCIEYLQYRELKNLQKKAVAQPPYKQKAGCEIGPEHFSCQTLAEKVKGEK